MESVHIAVSAPTHVSEARRGVLRLASRLGFEEVAAGHAAIVVSEAASNLIKHAGGGQIVIRSLSPSGQKGIEILALDKGPGMPDTSICLADGFSSTKTAGTGLGAIKRLSSTFQVYSRRGCGTALMARLWCRTVAATARQKCFAAGGLSMPHPSEDITGDSWSVVSDQTQCAVMVADGLGHGPLAAEGACAAAVIFEQRPFADPAEVLGMAHDALRATRGAAVAVARIDGTLGRVDYAGVGNIAAVLLGPEQSTKNMVSLSGTVGHNVRRIAPFHYAWPAGGILLMYSDGLSSHWSFDRYPGLLSCDPALIASVLCRDFRRPYDDVTVVAVKSRRDSAAPEAQVTDEH